MRKAISLFLVLLLFASVPTAFAQDVTTFGFNAWMTRFNKDMQDAPVIFPAWRSDVGTSYSQPLIMDGSSFGLPGQTVFIAAAGNTLYGWKSPAINAGVNPQTLGLGAFTQNDPVWSANLSGDTPTKSHPTLVTINGRKIAFIGTEYDSGYGAAALQAIDVTDAFTTHVPIPVLNKIDLNASDIVSAPLITRWNNHWIALYSTGNTGRVCVMTGLDQLGTGSFNPPAVQTFYLSLGGRTSSTPIGVMYQSGWPTAFAMGVDGGLGYGELRVYRLDDILSVDGSGNVVVTNIQTPFIKDPTTSGIAASFSASDDGNNVYFGDTSSNIYSLNVPSNSLNWPKNTDLAGKFSNRSPALSPNYVYFPSGTSPGDQGSLISIDRNTGQTNWIYNLQYACQTAPSVWPTNIPGAVPSLFVGNSKGYIAQICANDGSFMDTMQFTDSSGSSYATGITGEISFGNGYMVVSTNAGLLAWAEVAPVDMQAVSIDPGCPKDADGNYDPQPGQTYTATVTVNCQNVPDGNALQFTIYPGTPVGAFTVSSNNTVTKKTLNFSGTPLPTSNVTSEYGSATSQVDTMQPGQQRTYTFTWTSDPANPPTELDAIINLVWPTGAAQITQYYPELKLNLTNNRVSVPLKANLPDLVAVSIGSNLGSQVDPDSLFIPTLTFENNSTQTLTGVPIGATVDSTQVTLYDENDYPISAHDFQPGEKFTCYFRYTSAHIGQNVLKGYINISPLPQVFNETRYDNNMVKAIVGIKPPDESSTNGDVLTFQAQTQPSILDTQVDEWGNPLGPIMRQVNTAKFTDIVTGTLTPHKVQNVVTSDGTPPDYTKVIAPPPPNPERCDPRCTSYSVIDRWEIIDSKLTYPKQNSDYSFGHPLPPDGSITRDMDLHGKYADIKFKEMWAEDGAPVYDRLAGQMVPDPQYYTITADYTVRVYYTVYLFGYVCRGGPPPDCNCELTYQYSYFQDYDFSASGQLLVNGTGVASLSSGGWQ